MSYRTRNELMNDIDSLHRQLDEKRDKLEDSQQHVQELQKKLDESNQKIEELNQRIHDLSQERDNIKSRIARVVSFVEDLRDNRSLSDRDVDSLISEYKKVRGHLSDALNRITILKKQLVKAKDKYNRQWMDQEKDYGDSLISSIEGGKLLDDDYQSQVQSAVYAYSDTVADSVSPSSDSSVMVDLVVDESPSQTISDAFGLPDSCTDSSNADSLSIGLVSSSSSADSDQVVHQETGYVALHSDLDSLSSNLFDATSIYDDGVESSSSDVMSSLDSLMNSSASSDSGDDDLLSKLDLTLPHSELTNVDDVSNDDHEPPF